MVKNSSLRTVLRSMMCLSMLCLVSTPTMASQPASPSKVDSPEPMPSLDEQVQEIKSDVLAIAAELGNLEERLLYPSSTQMAVFVSIAEGEELALDSVEIEIDGTPAARHIYSFKELEALQKGGVQRLYTGNVRTGDHQIDVSVTGRRLGGRTFTKAASFSVTKGIDPKLVGVTFSRPVSGEASIDLGDW